MESEPPENPYATPRSGDESPATYQRPGWLAMLFVGLGSSVAGVCVWYSTCAGFMMAGHMGVGGIFSALGMFASFVLSIPAGLFASRWARRTLVSKFSQKVISAKDKSNGF